MPNGAIGKTEEPSPIAQTNSAISQPAAGRQNDADERSAVLDAVNQWAHAWSKQDVQNYLDAYAEDFKTPDGVSRDNWAAQRRKRITNKNHIVIQVESPQITIDGNTATVNFRQIYQSDRLTGQSNKTLVLTKRDGHWKIQQERSGS
ncbi:MAG TPA: nuclear transport factor 2 family protein [Burkholderiaceae bacterium]